MGKKKKFIDKKNAVSFRLLHRSQRDPLITDEKAPQHVLHPLDDKHDRNSEQLKYGIYLDDGYDYMQHLRERSGQGELVLAPSTAPKKSKKDKGIALPSSVFPLEVEEKVGLLNRAPPRSGLNLDLDPDIVATMDSDYDYSDPENEYPDDFVMQLMGKGASDEVDGSDSDYDGDSMENYSDEERDELMSLEREETKSRFTEYSMTSSVIRRNEQLTLLDDRFEEMFSEYDDNEIGPLDTEEIEGESDEKILQKFIKDEDVINNVELTSDRTMVYNETESSSDEENFEYMEIKPKEKWDCESILSTNSTLYNHPKLIEAPPGKIKVNSMGIPVTKNKLTASALGKHDSNQHNKSPGSIASAISLLSIRSKDETTVEKRNRKKAFRDFKRERRTERKINTAAFKEEKRKMEKMMANNKSRFQVAL